MGNNTHQTTQVYTGFVDILFGVVVGFSFTQFLPITLEFKAFAVILAYATVVASWVGYHTALVKGSDEYNKPYRFVIDLILLYSYNYLIDQSAKDFPVMLYIFPIIFGFYVLWELSRLWEWGKNANVIFRIKWNTIFLVLFLIQLSAYILVQSYGRPPNLLGTSWLQWVFWIASMTMIIGYRCLKEPPRATPSQETP